ncbi:MAG TPA: serine/threonine-protein kinase [Polyangium sp.]|nr:serine/threonine-protein kinase [Polyangium sp.]
MAARHVHPGAILARKYRVERVLGQGGMGVVVAARHLELGQLVALKQLVTGHVVNEEQRERFLREARAAVQLRSHHVARVLDVGTDENDAPYIVMEFLEGQDLHALLKSRGPLPFADAVEYVLQTCEAVAEAHAANIVHRDLKPANLFLTVDVGGAPCIKVLDFGISKIASSEVALTHESQMLGSPLYMSPEQMNAPHTVDARADIWALGIILYQLVASKTPFHAQTVQMVCAKVIGEEPPPLHSFRPDAPPGFEAVIRRSLAKPREMRFRDVAELAVALAPYASPRARVYVERVARALGKPVGASMVAPIYTGEAPIGGDTNKPIAGTVGAVSATRPKQGFPIGLLVGLGLVGTMVVGGILWIAVKPMTENKFNVAAPVVETVPARSVETEPMVAPEKPVPTIEPVASASSSATQKPLATAPATTGKAPTTAAATAKPPTKKNTSLYEP